MSVVLEDYPLLDEPYALGEAETAYFRDNGHVLLREVCSAEELAPYRTAFGEAVRARSRDVAPMAERDTYGQAFLQIMNLWREDEALKRFVFAKRFAKIAADLMGVPAVRLYHDQALYKEAQGGFTPWHQDQLYWPLDTPHTITLWMPFHDITPQMGTMTFASGSQRAGYLGHMPIEQDHKDFLTGFIEEKGFETYNHGPMKAGDATFHSGWCLHTASGNDSDVTREVMTVIYMADGAKVIEPDSSHRENDLKTWLPGCKPGELAASEINPVLYPASG